MPTVVSSSPGVNYNDGAMGGEVMRGNMLLNYVKVSIRRYN